MTMVKAVALSMLLSMTTQSAGATAMSAQNLKVTLNVTNTTVKGAIDRIEKTEGYVFVYTSDLLPELNAQGPCPSTTMPHLLKRLGLL